MKAQILTKGLKLCDTPSGFTVHRVNQSCTCMYVCMYVYMYVCIVVVIVIILQPTLLKISEYAALLSKSDPA